MFTRSLNKSRKEFFWFYFCSWCNLVFIQARACSLRTSDFVLKAVPHHTQESLSNTKSVKDIIIREFEKKKQQPQNKQMTETRQNNMNKNINSPLMSAVKCSQLFKSYNSRWKRSEGTALGGTRTYSLQSGAAENWHNTKSSYGFSTFFKNFLQKRRP